MNYRHIALTLAGLFVLAGVSGSAFAQAAPTPIVIKFSHVVAPDTPKGKGADRFKQLAEEKTGGRVRVEVYPNSQLYKDKEELEALQLGAVQMLAPSLAKFGPLGAKQFEVFDLPYIFPNKAALQRVMAGPVGAGLLKSLESQGIIGLAFWDNGFKEMSANRPLREIGDVKGLKMRIQSSKVLEAQMRAIRALPQVMAFSEVYNALQTGVVDGTENTPSNYYTQKTYEVQKYMTLSNHGYIGYAVITNKKFWDDLPADIRAKLDEAMKEATQYTNHLAQQENDDAIRMMKESGKIQIDELSKEQQDAWRKAMLPVHKEMAGRIGQDLIDQINKEVAAVGFK